ncbi:MAG: response regulator [Anaerolineales bacterium]|nr:response regulator [Anaerolineales bacterium]
MTRILIVDDDLALADVVAFTLRRAGFEVTLAHDGESALLQFFNESPDLILLDWTLPHLDGLEVCLRLRAESEVPIIMLTVRDSDDDVVLALEAGADDYVSKPFSPRRLVARIHAVLRRAAAEPEKKLESGCIRLDLERREVYFSDGAPISLTRLETRLMKALIENANHVITTEGLIARVWGPEGASRDMVKQLVYRLRKKLEPDPKSLTLIESIPNVGYVLNTPPDKP